MKEKCKDEVLKLVNETEILGKHVKLYKSIEYPLFETSEIANWLGGTECKSNVETSRNSRKRKGYIFKIHPWW